MADRQTVHVYFTRSDGKELRFDDAPMGITGLDGIDAPKVELFTEKIAIGDGDVVTGKRVASRTIKIEASPRIVSLGTQMRVLLAAFFNPVHTYDVQFVYGDLTRTARNCEIKAMQMPTGNIFDRFRFTITFLAPNGYLEAGGIQGGDINNVLPRFGWPYISIADNNKGALWGVFEFANALTFDNDGDAPTYIRAIFKAAGEDTIKYPRLIHGSSFIKVLTTLNPGDELEIDTEKRVVRLNGVNKLNLVSKDSSFAGMEMGTGPQTFGFAADTHEDQLSVRVYYAKRYYSLGG